MSSIVLNFPGGLDDLDKVFAVCDLLDNKNELIKEFTPEVKKYLVKKNFFHGVYQRRYQEMFDELIVSLIKRQIMKHFPSFTPEEIILLCDTDFLRMITNDFYFNPDNYLTKDGSNVTKN